jgi:hypothetical protein
MGFRHDFFGHFRLFLFFDALNPAQCWKADLPPIVTNDPYVILETYTDQAPDLYREYYGIGPAIEKAREADILIVGNSKPYFGFQNHAVQEFEKKTGHRVYNLSIPNGDKLAMTQKLIERHHLRPALLIVNENHFFGPGVSPYTEETLRMGYLQALSRIFEIDSSWFFRSHLHHWLPRLGLGKLFGPIPIVTCRSLYNGCLCMENFEKSLVPVADKRFSEEELTIEEFNNAMAFKKEMEDQGTQMVLTSVPYGTDDVDHLDKWIKDPERRKWIAQAVSGYERIDQMAKKLGLPCITTRDEGLFTFDGIHLDEPSAEKFANSFFIALQKNPVFQKFQKQVSTEQ